MTKYPHIGAMMILTVMAVFACQSSRLALPLHHEPLGTDLGGDYLSGELKVEGDCLKLYRLGWDEPGRLVKDQLQDVWLPVWPSGFTGRQDGDETLVIDGDGTTIAREGDVVRLVGRTYLSDETKQDELEKAVPEACQGLFYYLVGDEVSIVPKNEANVVPLPGSTLWFPRTRTGSGQPSAHMLAPPPEEIVLTLDGDCLRIGKDGPVVIWPTGFYPDTMDGQVVVRNGAGRVMAAVGQEMKLDSGGYIPGNSGPCRGPLWGGTRFLEEPTKP